MRTKQDEIKFIILYFLLGAFCLGQAYWSKTVQDLRAENTQLKLLLGYTDER